METEAVALPLVATCALGLEGVLADELQELGADDVQKDRGAVRFRGSHAVAYRACLRSRVASRVLLRLRRFPVRDARALYGGVHSIRWGDHLTASDTLRIDFVGRDDSIRDVRFGAMKTKDAIVDRIREDSGDRPSIDLRRPDVRVRVHLRQGFASVLLDLSGDPLFQRGWRVDGGPAPLKETLAAGLLRLAGWPAAAQRGAALVDPMCGSGTFIVEAAEMALGRAAGRHRAFGFERWRGIDSQAWQSVQGEADVVLAESPQIFGADRDRQQVDRCRSHRQESSLEPFIRLRQCDWADLTPPSEPGLIITNPPYGERLSDQEQAEQTMRSLGDELRHTWMGWTAWILAGSPRLAKRIGLKPGEKHELHNGALDCRFLSVSIRATAPDGRGPSWRA